MATGRPDDAETSSHYHCAASRPVAIAGAGAVGGASAATDVEASRDPASLA